MGKIKLGIIGNGWRTGAYLRIVKELPELFELTGIFFRDAAKASAFEQSGGGRAYTSWNEFIGSNNDYVILSVARKAVLEYCERLYRAGIPVLCETPPANGLSELITAWELKKRYNASIQVFEQCHRYPYLAAVQNAVSDGLLGRIHSLNFSMLHDYHAISVARKLFRAGFSEVSISAQCYYFPVTATCGRSGMTDSQHVSTDSLRKVAAFCFAGGNVLFYDFCNDQYFNYINTRHMRVQGEQGEVCDMKVNYLTPDGTPVTSELHRIDTGLNSNLEGYFHRGIMLDGRFLYKSPFSQYTAARLNDDELATAECMLKMKEYIESGKEFYPLEEALQDTYLSLLMDRSIAEKVTVRSEKQPWMR